MVRLHQMGQAFVAFICVGYIVLYPHQHSVLFNFFVFLNVTDEKGDLIAILNCVSLIISDTGHRFMCLRAIYISFSSNCLFTSVAHPSIGLVVFFFINLQQLFI